MPTIILDGTATLLSAAKSALVAITSTGVLYSWYDSIPDYAAFLS